MLRQAAQSLCEGGCWACWSQHGAGWNRKHNTFKRDILSVLRVCLMRLPGDSCAGVSYRQVGRVGTQPGKRQFWRLHCEEFHRASRVYSFICTSSAPWGPVQPVLHGGRTPRPLTREGDGSSLSESGFLISSTQMHVNQHGLLVGGAFS